jgi:hypothetical protein
MECCCPQLPARAIDLNMPYTNIDPELGFDREEAFAASDRLQPHTQKMSEERIASNILADQLTRQIVLQFNAAMLGFFRQPGKLYLPKTLICFYG